MLLPHLGNASPAYPPVPREAENPLYASNSSDDVYRSTATDGLNDADIPETQETDSAVSNTSINGFPGTVFVAESTATVTVVREVPVWTDAGGQRPAPSHHTLSPAPTPTPSPLPETTHSIQEQSTQQSVQEAAPPPPTVTVTATQVSTVTNTVTVQTAVVSTATTTETQTVTNQQQQQPNIQMIMNQPSPNAATVTVTATVTEQAPAPAAAAPQYVPQYVMPQPQPIVVVVPQAAGQMNYYPQQVGNYPANNNVQVDVQQSPPTSTPAPAPYPSQTMDGPTSSAPLPLQPPPAAQPTSFTAAEPPVSSGQSELSWVTVVETLDTTIFTTVTLESSEEMSLELTSAN
ncbi:hypothetical protein GGI11_003993 [Coemansia sp. RSA 2049]|nr:hypothetical protein GGI11_003993 [Coemansia sp. RSA 2049]